MTATDGDRWSNLATYSCSSCRFFVPKREADGRCRRHAPSMDGYPVVYPDDWCGDHKLGTNPSREKNALVGINIGEVMRDFTVHATRVHEFVGNSTTQLCQAVVDPADRVGAGTCAREHKDPVHRSIVISRGIQP